MVGADAQQLDVSQNLQLSDLLQVWSSVLVLQLMDAIDGHQELMKVTEDDDLRRTEPFIVTTPTPGIIRATPGSNQLILNSCSLSALLNLEEVPGLCSDPLLALDDTVSWVFGSFKKKRKSC